jgi:molybdopterin molybdotransferase
MAQLSNDCFALVGQTMRIDEAASLIKARLPIVAQPETVPLAAADGRILVERLVAPIDLPAFDNSAVDGYAVRHAELNAESATVMPVSGRVAAGHILAGDQRSGAAVRIFTGAPLPVGADTVFMQEDCQLTDGTVTLPQGLALGANRRRRGEDLLAGAEALPQGRRLTPHDIGLAAALGLSDLVVRRPLRVAVFSTGDELVSPGEARPSTAVYDSNRFVLQALLRRLGVIVSDLRILPDRFERVRAEMAGAAACHDLVLTSGGVSMGEEDHVRAAFEAAGSLVFWRLAIKPGRPVVMGVVQGTPLIGLPGNPVALFVTFAFVARPVLAALSGESLPPLLPSRVRAAFHYRKKAGRREFVRASLKRDDHGDVTAHKFPVEGAGLITSLTRTDGLVQLSEDVTVVAPGEWVDFLDFTMLR